MRARDLSLQINGPPSVKKSSVSSEIQGGRKEFDSYFDRLFLTGAGDKTVKLKVTRKVESHG